MLRATIRDEQGITGLGLIKYLGHWSAYAPGFDKIDENVEYSEGEDKLDYEDESDVERRRKDEQERTIEIFEAGKTVNTHRIEVNKKGRKLLLAGPQLNKEDRELMKELDEVKLDQFISFELDDDHSKDLVVIDGFEQQLDNRHFSSK
ncbi:hypothetical protein H4Q26_015516 [Puccinia striiformis f. sp. tritici PST-130]|nr:hypothetical protein H4Q26_015516 [Puccinia striiformis f. sp. tritici PST-130]